MPPKRKGKKNQLKTLQSVNENDDGHNDPNAPIPFQNQPAKPSQDETNLTSPSLAPVEEQVNVLQSVKSQSEKFQPIDKPEEKEEKQSTGDKFLVLQPNSSRESFSEMPQLPPINEQDTLIQVKDSTEIPLSQQPEQIVQNSGLQPILLIQEKDFISPPSQNQETRDKVSTSDDHPVHPIQPEAESSFQQIQSPLPQKTDSLPIKQYDLQLESNQSVSNDGNAVKNPVETILNHPEVREPQLPEKDPIQSQQVSSQPTKPQLVDIEAEKNQSHEDKPVEFQQAKIESIQSELGQIRPIESQSGEKEGNEPIKNELEGPKHENGEIEINPHRKEEIEVDSSERGEGGIAKLQEAGIKGGEQEKTESNVVKGDDIELAVADESKVDESRLNQDEVVRDKAEEGEERGAEGGVQARSKDTTDFRDREIEKEVEADRRRKEQELMEGVSLESAISGDPAGIEEITAAENLMEPLSAKTAPVEGKFHRQGLELGEEVLDSPVHHIREESSEGGIPISNFSTTGPVEPPSPLPESQSTMLRRSSSIEQFHSSRRGGERHFSPEPIHTPAQVSECKFQKPKQPHHHFPVHHVTSVETGMQHLNLLRQEPNKSAQNQGSIELEAQIPSIPPKVPENYFEIEAARIKEELQASTEERAADLHLPKKQHESNLVQEQEPKEKQSEEIEKEREIKENHLLIDQPRPDKSQSNLQNPTQQASFGSNIRENTFPIHPQGHLTSQSLARASHEIIPSDAPARLEAEEGGPSESHMQFNVPLSFASPFSQRANERELGKQGGVEQGRGQPDTREERLRSEIKVESGAGSIGPEAGYMKEPRVPRKDPPESDSKINLSSALLTTGVAAALSAISYGITQDIKKSTGVGIISAFVVAGIFLLKN